MGGAPFGEHQYGTDIVLMNIRYDGVIIKVEVLFRRTTTSLVLNISNPIEVLMYQSILEVALASANVDIQLRSTKE